MINYYVRGSNYQPRCVDWEGRHILNSLIETAQNLHTELGCKTYVVGVDYDTKQEHLVWHHAVGRIPHEHRFIKLENIMEGV